MPRFHPGIRDVRFVDLAVMFIILHHFWGSVQLTTIIATIIGNILRSGHGSWHNPMRNLKPWTREQERSANLWNAAELSAVTLMMQWSIICALPARGAVAHQKSLAETSSGSVARTE
jgi:hypothetical protein